MSMTQGHGIPESEIESIINNIDYHENGQINYTEFLVATLEIKRILSDKKLKALFKQFDTDGTGNITREDIVKSMNKMGHGITQEELEETMAQHDIKHDGQISFIEFKALILDLGNVQDAEKF